MSTSDRTSQLVEYLSQASGDRLPANAGDFVNCPCPGHEDGSPSLGWTVNEDGSIGLRCHAGCEAEQIVTGAGFAVGEVRVKGLDEWPRGSGVGIRLKPAPEKKLSGAIEPIDEVPDLRHPRLGKPDIRYDLRGLDGKLYAVIMRWDDRPAPGRKIILPYREFDEEGKPTLAGVSRTALPMYGTERMATTPADHVVFICEGEKAAQALIDLGKLALGTGGADQIPDESVLAVLDGRRVVLWVDNDEPGRKWRDAMVAALVLRGRVESLKVFEPADAPEKGDAFDYFASGKTLGNLTSDTLKLGELMLVPPPSKLTPEFGSKLGNLTRHGPEGPVETILWCREHGWTDQETFWAVWRQLQDAGAGVLTNAGYRDLVEAAEQLAAARPADPLQAFRDLTGLNIQEMRCYVKKANSAEWVAIIDGVQVEIGSFKQFRSKSAWYASVRTRRLDWVNVDQISGEEWATAIEGLCDIATRIDVDDQTDEIEDLILGALYNERKARDVALASGGSFEEAGVIWFPLSLLKRRARRQITGFGQGKPLTRVLDEIGARSEAFTVNGEQRIYWGLEL